MFITGRVRAPVRTHTLSAALPLFRADSTERATGQWSLRWCALVPDGGDIPLMVATLLNGEPDLVLPLVSPCTVLPLVSTSRFNFPEAGG